MQLCKSASASGAPRTVAEEVEGRRDARLEAVLEQVLGGLAGVAVHLHEAHLAIRLCQGLRQIRRIVRHPHAKTEVTSCARSGANLVTRAPKTGHELRQSRRASGSPARQNRSQDCAPV